jgi:BirA family biotin operon repressor/biotin-[acetyl-CoA-carboxylase] ligase
MSGLPPPLETAWLGRAWKHLAVCASTNDEAAAWARAGAPAGAVVTADAQTAGRGRLRRPWHSPPGESLYFSTVLRPSLEPALLPPITLAAGVATAEAISRFGVSPRLKWPNDLLVATPDGDRKVAGILTEMASSGARVEHLIVGIGVNLNVQEFPDELLAIASSLRLAGGAPVDRARFAAVLCERLEDWFNQFSTDGAPAVVAGWKRFAAFFGRRVEVRSGRSILAGVAEDLASDGALLVRTDEGVVQRVIAGELADA